MNAPVHGEQNDTSTNSVAHCTRAPVVFPHIGIIDMLHELTLSYHKEKEMGHKREQSKFMMCVFMYCGIPKGICRAEVTSKLCLSKGIS